MPNGTAAERSGNLKFCVPFGSFHLVPMTRMNRVGQLSFNQKDDTLLGFYPLDPASGEYELGSPFVERATLRIGAPYPEAVLRIVARDYAPGRWRVKRVTLNGRELADWRIRHVPARAACGDGSTRPPGQAWPSAHIRRDLRLKPALHAERRTAILSVRRIGT